MKELIDLKKQAERPISATFSGAITLLSELVSNRQFLKGRVGGGVGKCGRKRRGSVKGSGGRGVSEMWRCVGVWGKERAKENF